jgi:Bacterial Ig-like domain/FlgD Ig-like domain
MMEFGDERIRVTAGMDPTWPSYSFSTGGWAVPGGRATLKVSLANHTAVGSVRTFLMQGGVVPNVGWLVGVETTERTQGFQADWTLEGNQLQVHLFSTSGAVIEPGLGPIYRLVYQVNSDVGERDYSYAYSDTPDVIKGFGFRFVRPDGTFEGFGSSSVVLDAHGAKIPWCGTNVLTVSVPGGGIVIIDPAAVFETPLFVTGMAPSAGAYGGQPASNVDVDANVTASFSEAALPATVNGSTMTLTRAGGSGTVSGTVTLSGLTATLNPHAPLEYGTIYWASVTQGVQGLEGNPLDSNFGWSFTTVSTPTAVEEPAPPEAPSVTASPNPFGGETSIAYGLPIGGHASVRVYSASGRLIRTLADSDMPAGVHLARWDGRDSAGAPVSSGVYFLQFAASGVTKTQRLMLLR